MPNLCILFEGLACSTECPRLEYVPVHHMAYFEAFMS